MNASVAGPRVGVVPREKAARELLNEERAPPGLSRHDLGRLPQGIVAIADGLQSEIRGVAEVERADEEIACLRERGPAIAVLRQVGPGLRFLLSQRQDEQEGAAFAEADQL